MRRQGTSPGTSAKRFRLDNTAYRLLNVRATGIRDDRLSVKAERGMRSGIALVGRDGPSTSRT